MSVVIVLVGSAHSCSRVAGRYCRSVSSLSSTSASPESYSDIWYAQLAPHLSWILVGVASTS
eukprot:scaffold17154_cov116-Cyclotella_meneghiniana.AAC.3